MFTRLKYCMTARLISCKIHNNNNNNVSAIFQVYINHALHDLIDNFCIIYFDDILVFSKFEEEYYQHLQLIIKCLYHTELYVNSKKCEFFKTEVKYLDFLINEKSLHMNFFHIKTVFK